MDFKLNKIHFISNILLNRGDLMASNKHGTDNEKDQKTNRKSYLPCQGGTEIKT